MREKLPTVALCGPGRCGKDTAAKWFAANTPLRFGLSTSQIIAPHVATRLGQPVEDVFTRRHENRQFWFDVGNELRKDDPAFLVRECLKGGEIVVGMRNQEEALTARAQGLVDLFVWIDRAVPLDPTMEFGSPLCDVIVSNWGTLGSFYRRLAGLARWAGLL